jgi:hypothetical protein
MHPNEIMGSQREFPLSDYKTSKEKEIMSNY